MTQRHRKIYLLITDLPIRLIVTAIAALAALSIWEHEYSSLHILEIVTVALMIRLAIRLQCGFIDQVSEDNDLKLFVNNLKSEIKFILAIITLLYLFDCAISREVAVSFLVFNAIGQAIPICLGQMIRTLSKLNASDAAALGVSGPHGYKTALIYGTGPKGKRIADLLTANPNSDIIPIGFIDSRKRGLWSFRDIPLIGSPKDIERIALERQVDLIFMAAEDEQLAESREVFASAERMGAPVCVMPDLFNTTVSRCHLKTFNGQPALVYSSSAREGVSTWLKTNADKALALMSIIIALPILLITAAVIKLTSRGPALFKQTRVGQNGAQFEVYKFRSMYLDAEKRKRELLGQNEMSGPVFKMKDDPRITPVGKFIRKFSIDELPQLFNVLKGEMSLVGPRPALPSEVRKFEPWQRRKLAVKPGVTCIWQVSGRNAIDFDDWMKLDLQYIDNWSLWMDAKIIARTIPTVLKGTGC